VVLYSQLLFVFVTDDSDISRRQWRLKNLLLKRINQKKRRRSAKCAAKMAAANAKSTAGASTEPKAGFSVSCRDLRLSVGTKALNLSGSSSASSANGARYRRLASSLRQQNAHLAAALNEKSVECRQAMETAGQLRAENMALRAELAEVKVAAPRQLLLDDEAEFQRRLAENMEPIKATLSQVLGHTSNLTDCLTRAMQMASAPGRRSRSLAAVAAAATNNAFSAFDAIRPHLSPRKCKNQFLVSCFSNIRFFTYTLQRWLELPRGP
jgi:hypothetical protein